MSDFSDFDWENRVSHKTAGDGIVTYVDGEMVEVTHDRVLPKHFVGSPDPLDVLAADMTRWLPILRARRALVERAIIALESLGPLAALMPSRPASVERDKGG